MGGMQQRGGCSQVDNDAPQGLRIRAVRRLVAQGTVDADAFGAEADVQEQPVGDRGVRGRGSQRRRLGREVDAAVCRGCGAGRQQLRRGRRGQQG